MNIKCTYNGSIVNIIDISPSSTVGYLDITYINNSSDTKHERIVYTPIIATSVTEIGGIST